MREPVISIQPVSYTHLDVYKRQFVYYSNLGRFFFFFFFLNYRFKSWCDHSPFCRMFVQIIKWSFVQFIFCKGITSFVILNFLFSGHLIELWSKVWCCKLCFQCCSVVSFLSLTGVFQLFVINFLLVWVNFLSFRFIIIIIVSEIGHSYYNINKKICLRLQKLVCV